MKKSKMLGFRFFKGVLGIFFLIFFRPKIIDKKNKIKKQIEILNRVRSYLNTLDENKVYSKEEINSGFVKKLSK